MGLLYEYAWSPAYVVYRNAHRTLRLLHRAHKRAHGSFKTVLECPSPSKRDFGHLRGSGQGDEMPRRRASSAWVWPSASGWPRP